MKEKTQLLAAVLMLLVASHTWALPIVEISEDVGGGIGEYTLDIQSPIGQDWYVYFFAAENEQSVLAGGDGAFVDNGIGEWTGRRFAPNQWQAGFDFTFDTPGGEETLANSLGIGNFVDLFGPNTFAHAYWPTSYLDFSAGSTFSLIGPNETRGGFKFHSPIVASNWVVLAQNSNGEFATLTGAVPTPPPTSVPETGATALLALGALLLLRQRRRNWR